MNVRDIEDKVYSVLSDTFGENVISIPPIDLLAICKKNNIEVLFADFKNPNYDGLIDCREATNANDTNAKIYVSNRLKGNPRANFTIAHLLGRWFLKIDDMVSIFYGKGKSDYSYEEYYRYKEADIFAAFLLIPTKSLEMYLDNYSNHPEYGTLFYTANKFSVSIQAMEMRLKSYTKYKPSENHNISLT